MFPFLNFNVLALLRFSMALKDLLTKKKDKTKASEHGRNGSITEAPPDITITRSDTTTNEILYLPPPLVPPADLRTSQEIAESSHSRRFRSSSNASCSGSSKEPRGEKRLSQILHIRSHSHDSSIHVPASLPSIDPVNQSNEETEAQWEARATLLAQGNSNLQHGVLKSEGPVVSGENYGTLQAQEPKDMDSRQHASNALSSVCSGYGSFMLSLLTSCRIISRKQLDCMNPAVRNIKFILAL